MTAEAAKPPRRPAPWRNRRTVPDPRKHFVAVRCTDAEHAAIKAAAAQAGMAVGAFLRATAINSPGPRARRRPPLERQHLAQVLGLIGRIGGNVNQLARAANTIGELPEQPELAAIATDIKAMRAALMEALGRGDQG